MIRRPPRSTLFPYTRSSDLTSKATALCSDSSRACQVRMSRARRSARSEEHTSELQSQFHLVCRLLLEKKKKLKQLIKTKFSTSMRHIGPVISRCCLVHDCVS